MRRVLFIFDTTGSMHAWIASVRQHVGSLATRILDEDDDCEIGFIAYGDYCDTTRMIQDSTHPEFMYTGELPVLGSDPPELRYSYSGSEIERWLANNHSTSGGDAPECIEYVLRYLRATHVPSAQAAGDQLIVFWIGDAPPHTPHDHYGNPHGLDWGRELAEIAPSGTTIYTALCGSNPVAAQCWGTMSRATGGISVGLNNINNLADTMIAVVKRETGQLDDFAEDVRSRGADAEMEEILVDLGASCHD